LSLVIISNDARLEPLLGSISLHYYYKGRGCSLHH